MALFSPEHLAAIALTALVAALATVAARGVANEPRSASDMRLTLALARGLGLLILAGFVAEQAIYVARGTWSARVNLPLQLSDAVTLAAIAALWRPRAGILTELVYFWGLSASLQAVLSPDLHDTYPDALFLTYFVTHTGAVVAACVLVFGLRLFPRAGAVRRVYALTAGFASLAAIGCLATGGNYMFLRRKPSAGSALDPLGPWPVYLLGAAALGLAMLLVLDAIARAAGRRDANDSATVRR